MKVGITEGVSDGAFESVGLGDTVGRAEGAGEGAGDSVGPGDTLGTSLGEGDTVGNRRWSSRSFPRRLVHCT